MKNSTCLPAVMEPLPARVMLSATLQDGVLRVNGTDGNDRIWIESLTTGVVEPLVRVEQEGSDILTFAASEINSIRVFGLGGNDLINADLIGDFGVTLSGGTGDDSIETFKSGPVLRGGAGDDFLRSVDHLGRMKGGAGDDFLITNGGRDIVEEKSWLHLRNDGTLVIHGSKKDDIIGFAMVVPSRVCAPTVADCGHARHGPSGIAFTFNGVTQRLPLGSVKSIVAHLGHGNDFISLNSNNLPLGSVIFHGLSIPARIFGGAGNDTIVGYSGNDLLSGGTGDDSITAGGGKDIVHGGEGEDFIEGGDGADFIRGGAGNDRLSGELGDDTLLGGRGSDDIDGGDGTNVLRPGPQ